MTDTLPLEIRYRPFLTCGLCYDTYNDPRLLDCSHTFCLSCLNTYINSGVVMNSIKNTQAFPCPFCQELVKPPNPDHSVNTWGRQFKVNGEVTQLLRQIERERKERQHNVQNYINLNNSLQNLRIGEFVPPENRVLPLFVPSVPPSYEETEMTSQIIPLSPIIESGEEGGMPPVIMNARSSAASLTEDIWSSNSHQRNLVRYELLTTFSCELPEDSHSMSSHSNLCLMEGGNTVVILDYNNRSIKAYYNVHEEVYVEKKTVSIGNKLGAFAINDTQLIVCGAGMYEAYTVTVLPELNIDCCYHFSKDYDFLVAGVNNTFMGLALSCFLNPNIVVDVMDRRGIVLENFTQSDEWYFPVDNFVPTSLPNKWFRRGASTLASFDKSQNCLCIRDGYDRQDGSSTRVDLSEVYDQCGDVSQADKDKSNPVALFFNDEDNACVVDAVLQCVLTFPLSQTSEASVIPIHCDDINLTDLTVVLRGNDGKLYCLSAKGIVFIFAPMYGSTL